MGVNSYLSEYYSKRPEFILSKDVSFSGIIDAKNLTLAYYHQNKLWDKNLENAKSVPITIENMVGLETEIAYDSLLNSLAKIASNFLRKEKSFNPLFEWFDSNPSYFAIKRHKEGYMARNILETNLKVNGSTLPLEVRLNKYNIFHKPVADKVGGEKANEIIGKFDRVIYLKNFDVGRLMGLELYSLISGQKFYNYAFNNEMIIEEQQEGKHEFDIPTEDFDKLKKSEDYIQNRIKLDLISFSMGLDDLAKKDNYLITEEGKINIIDFDVMDNTYPDEERKRNMCQSSIELGINMEEYTSKYAWQKFLLKHRIKDNKEKIYKLIKLYKNIGDLGYNEGMYDHLVKEFGDEGSIQ